MQKFDKNDALAIASIVSVAIAIAFAIAYVVATWPVMLPSIEVRDEVHPMALTEQVIWSQADHQLTVTDMAPRDTLVCLPDANGSTCRLVHEWTDAAAEYWNPKKKRR